MSTSLDDNPAIPSEINICISPVLLTLKKANSPTLSLSAVKLAAISTKASGSLVPEPVRNVATPVTELS